MSTPDQAITSDDCTIAACRSCGSPTLQVVLSLDRQPLANRLLPGDKLGTPEPRYPLELALCTTCSLAQSTVSIPPSALFTDYPYFSSYAETAVSEAEKLVQRMIKERELGPHDLVMEIASNDGYLLQHYVRAGVPVLGVDPARNIVRQAEARGVRTICAFFGEDLAEDLRSKGYRASVLHANNVLAHVPDVNGFVRGIGMVLADDGIAVFETPYVRDMVDNLEFDTIYHEHLFYYSLSAMDTIFRRNGLQVVDVERIPIHGGSLRIHVRPGSTDGAAPAVQALLQEEADLGIGTLAWFWGFADRVSARCRELASLLTEVAGRGKTIAGYGAAAKGTVLLNAIGPAAQAITFVADRNPMKQGLYMPGVHLPVVSPERLVTDMPDYTLLLVWNFADEVLSQQSVYRARGGQFIIATARERILYI